MPTVTKLARVAYHSKELPPKNLHDPSIRWSCDVI